MSQAPSRFRSRAVKLVIFAIIAAFIVWLLVAKVFSSGKAPEQTVFTAPVALGSIEETVLATGTLEPVQMVNVGAQVSGQVKTLFVESGQPVKAGDRIAEIDSVPQENALRVAKAELANSQALRKVKQVQLKKAQAAYERQTTLLEQKAASQMAFDTAESDYFALQAEIASLGAQIEQAEVNVETATSNLGYTRIVSPIDGTVIAVVTKQGQTLNSSQTTPTVVIVAKLDTMNVKVKISEADVWRTKPGQKVWFTIMGDAQTKYDAELERIDFAPPSITTDAKSSVETDSSKNAAIYYDGLLTVPNPDSRLRTKMTAQVHIIIGSIKDKPIIPWSALSAREPDGRYKVTVKLADGKTEQKFVKVGLTDMIKAEILEGLKVGDEVVIEAGATAPDATQAANGGAPAS
ncbi:efflux RND transporter periplasmic adaptor subunit [Phyllobacterium sp. YR531]|uniref:efflux RND transporter periplasmic adaptor subunit n=1 Tax=Phyllobacterium sp. YR531 TaxID=1144343 RepID=UPI00026FAA2D|nr:efflux RND transporter periplasmic adaptor subunit [Phyllobacterium sp. YR531]EJN00602.1 RND family efflux transporter, MFP subunit [Phyllobacterium sp. YR531]